MYIFTGDNWYEVKAALETLTHNFIQQHGDLAVERFDGEEASLERIVDAIQSMPFLSPAKLVLVTNATSKDLLEQLPSVEVPETTEVIVTIPKIDKRAGYFKKLSAMPGYKNFEQPTLNDLPTWVIEQAKIYDATISLTDARFLVERVGTNQLLLRNEVEKLSNYDRRITRHAIEELCEPSPQSSTFQLIDAAFGGNLQQMKQLYEEQRTQKVEPHAIMGLIAWQLHVIALVKAGEDKSSNTIAKEARLNPYVVSKSSSIAKRLSKTQIRKMVTDAYHLDVSLKSRAIDADDAVLAYLLSLRVG